MAKCTVIIDLDEAWVRLVPLCVLLAALSAWPSSLIAGEEPAPGLAPSYDFSFPGGLSRFFDYFSFSPPSTLTVTRLYTFPRDRPPASCTFEVPACGQGDVVNSCDLERALLNDHVVAAWPDEGEQVFGGDARHYDGSVFTITGTAKGHLTVGVLCRDDDVCSEEHQALLELSRTFSELNKQALTSTQCTGLAD